MENQGIKKTVRRHVRKANVGTFVKHAFIVLAVLWLLVSQVLAVWAIKFLVSNYRFVPAAVVKTADVVITPLAE